MAAFFAAGFLCFFVAFLTADFLSVFFLAFLAEGFLVRLLFIQINYKNNLIETKIIKCFYELEIPLVAMTKVFDKLLQYALIIYQNIGIFETNTMIFVVFF